MHNLAGRLDDNKTQKALASKREKIIERGKIRSEDDYYLIRDYIDDVEGEPGSTELLDRLYKLVDK